MTDVLQQGDLFAGRYLVERRLGEGGFAQVFECRVQGSSDVVALKVLLPNRDGSYDRETVGRFNREAAALARLRSKHAIRLVDFGEEDGFLFLVTQRLGGEDLSDHLKSVPRLDEATARHVLLQLLDALEDAHSHGLLHRDIKPENIRVERRDGDDYFVTLFDFGLARSTDASHPSVTATGELIGTPRYMSPEQLRGAALTTASDIYSLGVVLLELLLGREALHGASWGAQLDRMRTGHVLAAPMIEHISPPMQALIAGMTAPRQDARLGTVAAVRHLLEGNTRRYESQQRTPSVGLVGAGVLAAMVFVIAVITLNGADPPSTPAVPPLQNRNAGTLLKSTAGAGPAVEFTDKEPGDTVHDAGNAGNDAGGARGGSAGCGTPLPFRGDGLLPGDLHAYVPASYANDQPRPMVILLHQWDENGADILSYTGFKERADRAGVVLIAPTSFDEVLGFAITGAWNNPMSVVFTAKQVAEAMLCIDPSQIFLVGQASGGAAAYDMLCEDWVAGIATNGFRLNADLPVCSGASAKPHLLISARDSTVDPFNGGDNKKCRLSSGDKLSVRQQEQMWVALNACRGKRKIISESHPRGRCYRWDCEKLFESCHIDGGQQWPGTTAGTLYRTIGGDGCVSAAPDFPVGATVWDFLMRASAKIE